MVGTYRTDTEESVISESSVNSNLGDFKFSYLAGTDLYTLNMKSSSSLRYQEIVDEAPHNISIENHFMPSVTYTGRTLDITFGEDLTYITMPDGSIARLSDDELFFTRILFRSRLFKNGAGLVIDYDKYDCDLYVRYAGDSEYTLKESFKNQSKDRTWSFSESDHIAAWYIVIHDVTESVLPNTTWNEEPVFTNKHICKSGVAESGTVYSLGYINVYAHTDNGLTLVSRTTSDLYDGELMKDVEEYDLATYGSHLRRRSLTNKWSYYKTSQYYWNPAALQSFDDIVQDDENQRFTTTDHTAIKLSLGTNLFNPELTYKDQYDHETMVKGFRIYNLLPVGVELDSTADEIAESLDIFRHGYHHLWSEDFELLTTGNNCPCHSASGKNQYNNAELYQQLLSDSLKTEVNITENWNNTGRIKVEIVGRFTTKYWLVAYYYNTYYQFTYDLKLSIPYESYLEYGSIYTSYCGVTKLEEQAVGINMGSSPYDNGSKDPDAVDIDEDGDLKERLAINLSSITLNAVFSAYQNTSLKVQTDLSNYRNGSAAGSAGTEYNYKMTVTTGADSVANLTMYNSLENAYADGDTYWKGELLDIDTSYAESKGWNVEVSYSEEPGAGRDSEWKPYTDADKDKVQSLRFRFLDSSGNGAILQSNALAYVLVKLRMPEEGMGSAQNSFYAEWNPVNAVGQVLDTVTTLQSNKTRVSIAANVSGQIAWDDEDMEIPEKIPVTLLQNGVPYKTVEVTNEDEWNTSSRACLSMTTTETNMCGRWPRIRLRNMSQHTAVRTVMSYQRSLVRDCTTSYSWRFPMRPLSFIRQ